MLYSVRKQLRTPITLSYNEQGDILRLLVLYNQQLQTIFLCVKPTHHLNGLISFQNCALALQARWCSVASWSLLWFITDWAGLCFDMADSDPEPQSVWLAVFIPGWAAPPLAFTHTWTYLQTNPKRHTHKCVHADSQSTKLLGGTRWRWTSVKRTAQPSIMLRFIFG